ncbi:MAG: 4-(cytidine 5'-diphospho)-2-C-methyl-D-erythritol kinase, partial [Prevotella pectinovora]
MNKITLFPCAKINLGLNITRKRSDGYHDLETVFCPVPIADILTIEKNGKPAGCSLKTNGIVIDGRAEDNIIVKAYDEMARRHTLTGVDITITKNIPIQAGMGGGSADCAFTIKGLNQLFSLNLTDGEMRDIAKGLGADCAFFINPTPAYATGIGEKLTPVDIPIDNHWIVIVKTDTAVSTREAF